MTNRNRCKLRDRLIPALQMWRKAEKVQTVQSVGKSDEIRIPLHLIGQGNNASVLIGRCSARVFGSNPN